MIYRSFLFVVINLQLLNVIVDILFVRKIKRLANLQNHHDSVFLCDNSDGSDWTKSKHYKKIVLAAYV